MYKLIGNPATRVFRITWMLEELGQTYEIIPANPASDEAKKYNPLGKVPAFLDGDELMTDSVAVMTYLADKHGAMTFPAGTPDRARQDALTLWLIDEFDAILWANAKHSFVWPEDMRVAEIGPSLQGEFERSAKVLSDRLDGPFLMGDQMTVPDILAVHCLNWSVGAKFPRIDDKLAAWAKTMRDRAAYKTAWATRDA